jgi:hypothetical protein
MDKYWIERDGWRAKSLLDPKWEGSNMALAFPLLMRNGGFEDYATMVRLAAGKKWDYQRYNIVPCKACQGDFRGPSHPLLRCSNLTMTVARNLWVSNCREHISKAKPARMRNKLLEIMHHVLTSEGGEFAAVGTFLPGWVKKIEESTVTPPGDLYVIKKFLRVVAGGARLVMREYSRIKEVSEGNARELRQLSMGQFLCLDAVPKQRKPTVAWKASNAPPDTVWESTGPDGKHLEWKTPEHTSTTECGDHSGREHSRRRAAHQITASKKQNPWKNGLQWFSPRPR